MAKNTTKTVSINSLKVDRSVNVRESHDYDIPAMKQSILDLGGITDPIHARLCDSVVLRGNRRTISGQELLADPNTPQDVAEHLKKVTVIYHDVVPGSPEELEIILDHGRQLGLSKTAVLKTVWKMDKQFMSESQIVGMFYSALAQYTNNPKKAQEAAAITNLRDRQEFLRKWLHGTVGNYLLSASKMGEYVREQMVKTHLSDDKALPAGDKVEMRCSRDRITQLSKAKSDDDVKNGGKGWSVDAGGEKFNALIEKFKAEDRGEDTGDDAKKRPTTKELRERADVFKTPAIRNTLLLAAGDKEHGKSLVDLDDQLHRLSMVTETLSKRLNDVTNPDVKALLAAIIGTGPAGEVEVLLNKFTS